MIFGKDTGRTLNRRLSLIRKRLPIALCRHHRLGSVGHFYFGRKSQRAHHTSSVELAAIAQEVKPGLLVLYHRSSAGGGETGSDDEAELIGEIRQFYNGRVVTGRDLDVF
jgi:hypothetical protein